MPPELDKKLHFPLKRESREEFGWKNIENRLLRTAYKYPKPSHLLKKQRMSCPKGLELQMKDPLIITATQTTAILYQKQVEQQCYTPKMI